MYTRRKSKEDKDFIIHFSKVGIEPHGESTTVKHRRKTGSPRNSSNPHHHRKRRSSKSSNPDAGIKTEFRHSSSNEDPDYDVASFKAEQQALNAKIQDEEHEDETYETSSTLLLRDTRESDSFYSTRFASIRSKKMKVRPADSDSNEEKQGALGSVSISINIP